MASPDLDTPWSSIFVESFNGSFDICIEEGNSADMLHVLEDTKSSACYSRHVPIPPSLPSKFCSKTRIDGRLADSCCIPKETKDTWDNLFKQGYGADVRIVTEDGSTIEAHQIVLSVASPILGSFLQQSKVKDGIKCIKVPGIPYDALYAFIRFLYSSSYEEEQMKKCVLHLLVLSHSYAVPSLKRVCTYHLEQGWLNRENVVDVLQLARKCDAPRLALVCLRMIVRDFKSISATEGWKVMKRADPGLEQELLELVVEEDSRKQERLKKVEENKVYMQLYEAMEALLHICRDGCRTIGPRDKMLKGNQVACGFQACKGLETLIRHFSVCKTRVPGRCVHCKRMWQLLELHSRMCDDPDYCKVPLCRHFKEKMQTQSKKEETKWKLLVSKVMKAKNGLRPFSSRRTTF